MMNSTKLAKPWHRLPKLLSSYRRAVTTAVTAHKSMSAAALACKKLLGQRTMIIADLVNSNAECNAHLHLQFELQSLGVQAAIFHMRQPIPTQEIFTEAKYMMQRLGATSLCSIGSAYTTDLAKGLKYMQNDNTSDFSSYDSAKSSVCPLVTFPTSLSPHHTAERICYVHKTENVLLSHPTPSPDAVFILPDLIKPTPSAVHAAIAAGTLDLLFQEHFCNEGSIESTHFHTGVDRFHTEQCNIHNIRSAESYFDCINALQQNQDKSRNMLTSILDQVARILYVHQELPDRPYSYFYNLALRTILEHADEINDFFIEKLVRNICNNQATHDVLTNHLHCYEAKWCRFNSSMSIDSVIENHLITSEENCKNMNPHAFQKMLDLIQNENVRKICNLIVNG